ncbi:MAG: HAD family phosphatase [Clostridiales bacterium]|nr:HAD family phosphatase [Clostridiales bacterium]
MIKNIVFDLGKVLLNFKPLEYLSKKISDEKSIREINEAIFKSPEWLMLDRGTITENEAIDRICERNKENSELIKAVMDDWYQMLTPIDEIVDLLIKIKDKGYSSYYLSNFHQLAFENVTRSYEFFKCFDGGIVSYRVGLLKPEKEIYEKLATAYGIRPKETIFIDDTLENILAAKSLGFEAIHFTGVDDLRDSLSEYNVI